MRIISLIAAIILCSFASEAQVATPARRIVMAPLIADLPAVGSPVNSTRVYIVNDAVDKSDCSIGGGTEWAMCIDDGSNWVSVSGAGSATTVDGITFELTGIANGQVLCYDSVDGRVEACTPTLEADFPAATCVGASATNNIEDDPTLTEPAAACFTGAGSTITMGVSDFDDAADEGYLLNLRLPSTYLTTMTINVELEWFIAATTGAVGWCVQSAFVPSTEPFNPTFNAAVCSSATVNATTLEPTYTTITPTQTGEGANNKLFLRIFRDGNGSSVTDSATGDARLVSVRVKIQ